MAAVGLTTQNAILDEVFKLTNRAADAAIYLGLSQTDPLEDGSGLSEPSGGSYARVNVTAKFTTAAANGEISNDGTITFPLATADWGSCAYWFIANHLTNTGNAIRWRGPMDKSVFVTNGFTLSFAVGEITATLD